jgi:hypothetical protein
LASRGAPVNRVSAAITPDFFAKNRGMTGNGSPC